MTKPQTFVPGPDIVRAEQRALECAQALQEALFRAKVTRTLRDMQSVNARVFHLATAVLNLYDFHIAQRLEKPERKKSTKPTDQ